MLDQVILYPKLERQLCDLDRKGNAPKVAAQRARQVIDALTQGEIPTGSGLMRARNDRRVKNSLKFNLGQGFRLICIREKHQIYVMFAGDHDSSDAWLTHYTRKRPHLNELDMDAMDVGVMDAEDPEDAHRQPAPKQPGEEARTEEIPQAVLRQVFKGICTAG